MPWIEGTQVVFCVDTNALDGDLRICGDAIVVTHCNASSVDRLRLQYEHLSQQRAAPNVNPAISWLYNFKLDFRFKSPIPSISFRPINHYLWGRNEFFIKRQKVLQQFKENPAFLKTDN